MNLDPMGDWFERQFNPYAPKPPKVVMPGSDKDAFILANIEWVRKRVIGVYGMELRSYNMEAAILHFGHKRIEKTCPEAYHAYEKGEFR